MKKYLIFRGARKYLSGDVDGDNHTEIKKTPVFDQHISTYLQIQIDLASLLPKYECQKTCDMKCISVTSYRALLFCCFLGYIFCLSD
jgi:hypothetical protein